MLFFLNFGSFLRCLKNDLLLGLLHLLFINFLTFNDAWLLILEFEVFQDQVKRVATILSTMILWRGFLLTYQYWWLLLHYGLHLQQGHIVLIYPMFIFVIIIQSAQNTTLDVVNIWMVKVLGLVVYGTTLLMGVVALRLFRWALIGWPRWGKRRIRWWWWWLRWAGRTGVLISLGARRTDIDEFIKLVITYDQNTAIFSPDNMLLLFRLLSRLSILHLLLLHYLLEKAKRLILFGRLKKLGVKLTTLYEWPCFFLHSQIFLEVHNGINFYSKKYIVKWNMIYYI